MYGLSFARLSFPAVLSPKIADKVADAVLRKLDHTLPAVVLTPSGERLRAAATRRERIARGHAQPDDLNLPRRVVVYLRHRSRESS